MIKAEDIVKELEAAGYKATIDNVVKNSVDMEAVIIDNGNNTGKVYYMKDIPESCRTARDAATEMIRSYNIFKMDCAINAEELLSRDNIEENITIGIQKASDEDIVKRESMLEGIEEYLFVNGENYSFKLKNEILEKAGIDEADAWDTAYQNLKIHSTMTSMADAIGMPDLESNMYILSNDTSHKGAAAFLNHEFLQKIGKQYDTNEVILLPSSIHEVIVIPHTGEEDINELSRTVGIVNTTIPPEETLPGRAYVLTISEELM